MSNPHIGNVNLNKVWSQENLGPFGNEPDKKTPFKFYIFPDLLDTKVANQLRDDINSTIKLKPKDNDLYKFKQSKDLKVEIPSKKLTPLLHEFIDVMLGPILEHLEKITNLKLSSKNFDITASRYDVGNYLLCHNDDIKDNVKQHGRALAFVYYLNTRAWTQDDGGALIIYDSDESGNPHAINNMISPKPNTLVVFNTSSTSWHSVQEVFCKDDFRLSINGWFHTDNLIKSSESARSIESCPPSYSFLRPIPLGDRLEEFFNKYLNPDYLMEKTCLLIRRQFKKQSEINLTNFLVKEKYKEISDALKEAVSKSDNLEHVGPYNKRNYKVIKLENLPQICKDLFEAFRSELFFMLLSRMTGLDLQPPSIKTSTRNGDEDVETSEEETSDDSEVDEDEEASGEEDEENDEDEEAEEEEDSESCDEEAEIRQVLNEDHPLFCNEDTKASDKRVEDDLNARREDENSENVELDSSDSKAQSRDIDSRKEENGVDICDTQNPVRNDKDDSQASKDPPPAMSFTDLTQLLEQRKRKLAEEPTTSKKANAESKQKSPRKRKRTSDPLVRLNFRHLDHGSYTIIHDYDFEMGEKSALDVIFHLNHDFDVNFEDGGYISYIDGGPDQDLHQANSELLTVEPKSNCLSLVYRCDEGSCRFLNYISSSHSANYQDLYCVYYERPDDLPKTVRDKLDL